MKKLSIKLFLIILIPTIFFGLFSLTKVFASSGDYSWKYTYPEIIGRNGSKIANVSISDSSGLYTAGMKMSGVSDSVQNITSWRIEKRDLSTGDLIWENYVLGDSTVGYYSRPLDIALDSTGVYVVGNHYVHTSPYRKIEKFNLDTGAVIWNVEISTGLTPSVAVNSSGLFTSENKGGGASDAIVKRDISTGAIIWSKNVSGTSASVASSPDGNYIYGSYYSSGIWTVQKMSSGDGSIVWTKSVNLGDTSMAIGAEAVDDTGVYISGSNNVSTNNVRLGQIVKLDVNDGHVLWQIRPNMSVGSTLTSHKSLSVTSDGLYNMGIPSSEFVGSAPVTVIKKIDKDNGNIIWTIPLDFNAGTININNQSIFVAGQVLNQEWQLEGNVTGPKYIDCGLRAYHNSKIEIIACELQGTVTSPLRISKNGVTYGIPLAIYGNVSETPLASTLRIKTSSFAKALQKL